MGRSSRKQGKGKAVRVVAVKFVPTAGVEKHLARVYDLLLRERPEQTGPKSESEDAPQNSNGLAPGNG